MATQRARYEFGTTTVEYLEDDGVLGLRLWPADKDEQVAAPREQPLSPLVHVKVAGQPYVGNFGQGRSMRWAPGAFALRVRSHGRDGQTVRTELADERGLVIMHELTWVDEAEAFRVQVRARNEGAAPLVLEQLDSAAVGGLTPFTTDDGAGRLRVHRFRSSWAFEGRHSVESVEDLHLERAPSGNLFAVERFGQVGTMPVRGWFPFVALEDTAAGVFWGMQLAWAGSWQAEIGGRFDGLDLSMGLADREFGHWTKTLAPGEELVAPPATLATVAGDLDALCHALVQMQVAACETHPSIEADLPIVFNEWCTTWGNPHQDHVWAMCDLLASRGLPVRFFVIDAGWFKGVRPAEWFTCHGDWVPDERKLPGGLKQVADGIRERGFVPGLWFEMETMGRDAGVFEADEHVLRRDGVSVVSNARKWWDLNDPAAIAYLDEKVLGQLRDGGFGYVKVDYNETLGVGADHADGLGEALRRQVEGTHRYFERLRAELPDLVIENCSSGGHRLEPSMIARSAMSSFSDAHETPELAIIAAQLHYLMLPRQSQIWAVLHAADSDTRLCYSLAATFLGRMGLSGEILELSEHQLDLLADACAAYQQAVPVIRDGYTHHRGEVGPSWRHPTGWQAVVRVGHDAALVVLHTFADAPAEVVVDLPDGPWRVERVFARPDATAVDVNGTRLHAAGLTPFDARVLLLTRS